MGLYDSIYADLRCVRCGYAGEMEIQTKVDDPCLNTYRVGSRVPWEYIRDAVLEEGAICPRCTGLDRDVRARIERELRAEFHVPEGVHETWHAWPDGTPVLNATKLHRAQASGDVPTYEAWCAAEGCDPKTGVEKGGHQWSRYGDTVIRPYLRRIRAPDMGQLHELEFAGVAWRDLRAERLDALRKSGDAHADTRVPVTVEVRDRVIVAVRIRSIGDGAPLDDRRGGA